MQIDWKSKLKRLGKVEKTFFALLIVYLVLLFLLPGSTLVSLLQFTLFVLSIWIIAKLATFGMRKAIWRLRNRLVATYVFIAVVPVFLIILLAGIGAYAVLSQLAVYLAVADLDRRGATLHDIAKTLAETATPLRPDVLERVAKTHHHRFPDLWVIKRTDGDVQTWPSDRAGTPPPEGWTEADGVMERRGRFYLWSHVLNGATRVTVMAPLSRAYLSRMLPGLPDVSLLEFTDDQKAKFVIQSEGSSKPTYLKIPNEPAGGPFPPGFNRFDIDVRGFSTLSIWRWDTPGKKIDTLLYVRTRPSVVLGTIFNTRMDTVSSGIESALVFFSILFLIVEIGALVIGVSLARTITRAVHNLYEGTQRVIEGDFSHRIAVHGKDQLATLSTSFNSMTENLEQLLVVAKEKERLQAEIEIAREVQNQLYPKVTPVLRTLSIAATCEPARMVSGDYYDYLAVPDGKLALAIGDVAGKGISAALLMATLQSAMRMELRTSSGVPAVPSSNGHGAAQTSHLVSDLNQLLYATTAPEKYATFFFALYDEATSGLSYTNAGHLPPLLVRNGEALRLDVNGTVVGAFPFASYEESRLRLESGDLLVCYTDGITEPENEYGEMFGEERLIELVTKNADCENSKLVTMILEAVHQWTSAAEQPDDMTLLLARKT